MSEIGKPLHILKVIPKYTAKGISGRKTRNDDPHSNLDSVATGHDWTDPTTGVLDLLNFDVEEVGQRNRSFPLRNLFCAI
jgi:hypothetical protein